VSLTLYAHPLSSYCQKAEMALYENDTAFEAVLIANGEAVSDEFRALWPIGKFPVLVDDGKLVFDTTTIIEYLDAAHPGPTRFIPTDPIEAVEVRMLDRFFDNYVSTPIQTIVGIAVGQVQGDEAALRRQLDTAYVWLNEWLAGRDWAAAGVFSLADCAAAPALLYADWTHPIRDEHRNIHAYRDRLLARPSYARALDDARPYRHMFPLAAPEGRD
jgi:glutathione S-transferase